MDWCSGVRRVQARIEGPRAWSRLGGNRGNDRNVVRRVLKVGRHTDSRTNDRNIVQDRRVRTGVDPIHPSGPRDLCPLAGPTSIEGLVQFCERSKALVPLPCASSAPASEGARLSLEATL
eukprot:7768672-Pyramimonas_sp.AAC.1